MFLNIQFWLFRILQRRLHNLQSAFRNYFQAQVCHVLHVFYISVCMFFAYLESSIVAVFYFALTSEGSLKQFKTNCPSQCGDWPYFEGEFQFFHAHHTY